MKVDIITIFPLAFAGYLNESILKRAQKKKLLTIRVHDLRRWTIDRHKTVDDRPYGGGPGMVMKVEPFYRAVAALRSKSQIANRHRGAGSRSRDKSQTRVILTSAKGKQFTQADARRLAQYQRIIILCGRYEGVDERVADSIADEELSIGPYVLTGGELPAMVVVDAMARHIPGVLGKAESLEEKRQAPSSSLGYPQYTRPEVFSPKKGTTWRVPKTLLSGDHEKIQVWREKQAKKGRG